MLTLGTGKVMDFYVFPVFRLGRREKEREEWNSNIVMVFLVKLIMKVSCGWAGLYSYDVVLNVEKANKRTDGQSGGVHWKLTTSFIKILDKIMSNRWAEGKLKNNSNAQRSSRTDLRKQSFWHFASAHDTSKLDSIYTPSFQTSIFTAIYLL